MLHSNYIVLIKIGLVSIHFYQVRLFESNYIWREYFRPVSTFDGSTILSQLCSCTAEFYLVGRR